MADQAAAAQAPKQSSRKRNPLFERLGGIEALRAAVSIFYGKLLVDVELKPFFEDVDMANLQAKQIQFMQFAFGGPDAYKGRDIAEAHRHLIQNKGLNEHHFDLVAGHFVATLKELGVAQEHIDDAVEVLLTVRPVFEAPKAA